MKESFWGYWIIVLGIFVVIIMMLVSSVTTTNTQDYYLIKNVTESAMVDAIDYGYYRQYKELRINREKFVENFLRRFAESVSLSSYTIDFYDIYEAPPKVSVKVTTKSGNFIVNGDAANFDIVNKVDAILELSGTAADGGEHSSDIKSNQSSSGNNSNSSNNSGNNSSSNNSNNNDNSSGDNANYDGLPTLDQLKRIVSRNREDFYYKENGKWILVDEGEFFDMAVDHFEEEMNERADNFILAVIQDLCDQYYPTLN